MAVGTYGNVRASDISTDDLDMFYTYSSSRENNSNDVIRLDPTELLEELKIPSGDDLEVTAGENLLGGMYNLTLPATAFNALGIYTIYIRPKEIQTIITDCGVLSAKPDVKGIVLDSNQLDANLVVNNALQGYRIEYLNTDNTKLRNVVRYVVSSNKVTPVTENIGNTSQTAIRYRFDDSGTLIFLQLTPSSASSSKPNVLPFIGNPNQTIMMYNTSMNPMAIEIEMVENTIDTVVNIIGGEQIKDVNNGILTHYDDDRNIIKQFNLFEIKDDLSDTSLYEVKEKRDSIDESQDFDDVTDSVN